MLPVHLIKPITITLAIAGFFISAAWVVVWIVILKKRWSKPFIGSVNLGRAGIIFMLILGAGILAGSIWQLVSEITGTDF